MRRHASPRCVGRSFGVWRVSEAINGPLTSFLQIVQRWQNRVKRDDGALISDIRIAAEARSMLPSDYGR